jgi:cytochrome c oxidase accessory protein FixG
MKLDQAPMSARKFGIKAAKQAAWILFALWTGFTFVGYFTPIHELLQEVVTLSLGPWETFWIFFYGFATYGNAGYMREQVCMYMCPYARFQGVMFDPDTLIITYDQQRGEPRGPRNKKTDRKTAGLGDCVDCGICVQVCPTGIDIRKGLQYECIGCAACIDACDQVMDKMNYPRGLIRYSTERAIEKHWGRKEIVAHVLRPRVLIYAGILTAIVVAMFYGLATRIPLKVNIIRDRTTLAREVEGGKIENVFRLQIMNTAEEPRRFQIAVSGMDNIELASDQVVEVPSAATKSVSVDVRVPADEGRKGSNRIYFEVGAIGHEDVKVREKASFLMP